jgi:hypothetical protein
VTDEFDGYPEPEPFDAKAEREKIRADERKQARDEWDISQARWSRFWVIFWGLAAALVVSALLWWAVVSIISNSNWNTARTAWVIQCRIEGGIPVRDIDIAAGPILCVIGDKVVRTRD